MNSEQAVDDRPQRALVVHQSEHLDSEICADGSWKQHSNFLEQATNLIFQVAADANQAGAGHKKRANDLASFALDPDLAVPPTLMSSASPRASFGSLLFSLTERAACAWRASIQTTGRLMRLSSCQSQLAIAPVSKPIRSAAGAHLRITRASAPGSDGALPSNRTFPS